MEKTLETNFKIVDDDIHIGTVLNDALTAEGYSVLRAYSGTEAVLLLQKNCPDLVLLDLMLPGLSGEEVLPLLAGIPTIIISAKIDVDSKVTTLLDGAADYITKPFALKELLARVSVQFRKMEHYGEERLLVGDIRLDTVSQSVTVSGQEVRLTRTEYAILKFLMQNSGRVIAKSVLLDRISFDTPDCTERSLKQHISNLRAKLSEIGGKDYIETIWGIGFKLG